MAYRVKGKLERTEERRGFDRGNRKERQGEEQM